MAETNWAEVQKRHDEGTISMNEAYRCGQTHCAYGWSCTPNGNWSKELQDEYRRGFHEYKATNSNSKG